jgi:hypothetical protein
VLSTQAILGPHKLLDDITSLLIAPSVIVRAILFKTNMARYGHTYIFSGGSAGKLSVHGSTGASKKKVFEIPANDELSPSPQGNGFEVRREHDHSDVALRKLEKNKRRRY